MKLAKIFFLIVLIVIYIFGINFLAVLISNSEEIQENIFSANGGSMLNLGVSDSVSIKVTRERFYGFIEVNNGSEYLYFLWFLKLPKKIQGYNFYYFHLIFLVILFLIILNKSPEKEKTYKEEIPFEGYERVV